MNARCPSDLALESHLLDPVASPLGGHLAACEGCRARLARMTQEGDDFRRFVFPATVDAVEAAADRRRVPRWFTMLLPVPALAAAAVAVVLLTRPSGPPDDYVGLRGTGGIGLTVFSQAGGGEPRILADGAEVPAAAALRFRVRASSPCRLFLLSVDADGLVSRLDPAGADGFPLSPGQQDLPGGAELDGKPGPERLFAVCAADPLDARTVEASARRASAGGAAGVRRGASLPGLPREAAQATLLLEKRP
jgi:hypothetical protein